MNTEVTNAICKGIRISVKEGGKEIGRAYLYTMANDLHEESFGLLEDVWIDEEHRGKGIGKSLVTMVIQHAREMKCYKLIATSRYSRENVHDLYTKLGFKNYGIEFRMNL